MHNTDEDKLRQQHWRFLGVAGLGFIMHAGTAVLRLRTFLPTPELIDFSAFYAAAAALRQGISPYGLSTSWLAALQVEMQLPSQPPAVFNPPLWPWLLQPLAFLRYPAAAWVWLLFNLGLLVWVAHVLYQSICMEGQPAPEPSAHGSLPPLISQPHFRMLLMFVGIVTFGPVFLDISIGQTSVLLLAMCIIIGQRMRQPDRWRNALVTAFAITLASITKLYPAAWLAALPLLRRWKQTVASLIVITSALSVSFLLMPDSSRAYWQQYLPQRVISATEQVGMDDQSLLAWLDRISQPHIYDVPGIETGERIQIVWQPDWAFDQRAVQNVGYVLCGLLGIPIILALLRSEEALREGGFYLWVLYILVVFPHMERYNQTLLLPAMVWLWYRGRYNLVAAVYVFTGLSRLNHLWITLLPAPWGPLATGFGLYAVLSLIWGMLAEIKNQPIVTRLT